MVARLDGARRRLAAEYDGRIYLAWHVAAFSRQVKLPELASLLSRSKTQSEQTPDEQGIALSDLFLAWGGDPAQLSQIRERNA